MKKITSKTNLPATFDNNTVTNFGNFSLLEIFKKAVGSPEFLQKHSTTTGTALLSWPISMTLRYLISKLTEDIEKLKTINNQLLLLKSEMENPREIWHDFDDTLVTVFGNQQGANVGYNPKYHGRKSFKIKVGFVSQTGELLNAGLYKGSANSNYASHALSPTY